MAISPKTSFLIVTRKDVQKLYFDPDPSHQDISICVNPVESVKKALPDSKSSPIEKLILT